MSHLRAALDTALVDHRLEDGEIEGLARAFEDDLTEDFASRLSSPTTSPRSGSLLPTDVTARDFRSLRGSVRNHLMDRFQDSVASALSRQFSTLKSRSEYQCMATVSQPSGGTATTPISCFQERGELMYSPGRYEGHLLVGSSFLNFPQIHNPLVDLLPRLLGPNYRLVYSDYSGFPFISGIQVYDGVFRSAPSVQRRTQTIRTVPVPTSPVVGLIPMRSI